MEKEIVYTDKYALILSDEPIIHNKYGFHIINRTISKIVTFNGYDWKDIIAHLPLSDAPILEGVPLLPPLLKEDDAEELAEERFPIKGECALDIIDFLKIKQEVFTEGYNKAKEKYKYTEEDLKLAMNYGYVQGDTGFIGVANLDDLLDLILRKIKKPSRPTHFECEMENCDKCVYVQGGNLSSDCCNQLKPKTITNSQGQVELVGKYLNL